MTNCGAGGSGTESCCASLEVTGGTYYRTYDAPLPDDSGAFVDAAYAGEGGPTGGSDPATVSTFRLDKYDVTVGRFRDFVNAWAAGWFPEAGSGKHTHLNGGEGLANAGDDAGIAYEPGWVASDNSNVSPTNANLTCPLSNAPPTWTALIANNENLPINCVNWYEAYAFCIWDGGFLPSEAEWEYAAAGGSEQREYPWGSAAPGTANQYAIYDCDYGSDAGGCPNPGVGSIANIAPVGTATLGAGLWGQLDLIGDLMVWTLDGRAPYVDPCSDCSDLGAISILAGRVFRGAGFDYHAESLSPPEDRDFEAPTFRGYYIGFRCARTP
jgi:formylglycine-generating enzyme required for sulfatase activity